MWPFKKRLDPKAPRYCLTPILHGGVKAIDLAQLDYRILSGNVTADEVGLDEMECQFGSLALSQTKHYFAHPDRFAGMRDEALNLVVALRARDKSSSCDAEASVFRTASGLEAHLILVNVESSSIIARGVARVFGALGDETFRRLAGDHSLTSSDIMSRAVLCGQLFVFFHELAHVVRGHLFLCQRASLHEISSNWLDLKGAVPRRVLETDADLIGAYFLRSVAPHVIPANSTVADLDRLRFACVLIGLFAVIGAMASESADASKVYHSPLVRMFALAKHFDDTLDGKTPNGDTLIRTFNERMLKSSLAEDPLLASWSLDPAGYMLDQKHWRETEGQRQALQEAGVFNRLMKS